MSQNKPLNKYHKSLVMSLPGNTETHLKSENQMTEIHIYIASTPLVTLAAALAENNDPASVSFEISKKEGR